MEKKKILIIDDSALMRRVMSDIIESDNKLKVVDTACNGIEGLEYLRSHIRYDLVIVDINMPRMDGVEFLEKAGQLHVATKYLVVSSIASKSTKETIQALELGAFDFVRKPQAYIGSQKNDFAKILLTKIHCAVGDLVPRNSKTDVWGGLRTLSERRLTMEKVEKKRHPIKNEKGKLVFIACSTGGPKSLQKVIPLLPQNFPYPVVVVQHMPVGFTNSLANRLNELSHIQVKEVEDGELLKNGCVYLAKGGHQCMLVKSGTNQYCFKLTKDAPRNGLRPCADIFMESLVQTTFSEIICAVLTGMGDDGSNGLIKLQEQKNVSVISQNEETCVVYGMPRAVVATGLVDEVVALDKVAGAIIKKAGE